MLCLVLFFTFLDQSSELVFMVESESSKQIGSLNTDKTYKLLTKGKAWHLYPDISKNSNKLAFVKGGSQTQLCLTIKDLKTNKQKEVGTCGFVLHPKFSNRSSKVFYSTKVGETQKIAIADLETNEISYIDEQINSYFPSPFQSGQMLVYQRNNQVKEIVLFDMLEDKKTIIGEGMSPSLSMDEKYIAYTKKTQQNWDIYIYNRIEKNTIKVTSNKHKDFSPVFDKDNNLIYTSDRYEANTFSILKQNFKSWSALEESEEVILSERGVSFYAPRFSGDKKFKLTKLPKMIGEARSSFGAITHKGMIYVAGGHQGAEHTYPPESFTARVTKYDIQSKSWSNLPEKINKAHGFQLAASGNFIYAFGGFAYEETNYPKWKSIDAVERFDIKNNKWEEIGTMPRRRSSNTVSVVDGKAYLIGGWDATPKSHGDLDGTFHSEIDVFDFKTLEWTELKVELPKKRRAFSSFVRDNKIYLVGGISQGGSHFSLLDDFTEFNPKTESFNEFPKLPFATFAPASGLLENSGMIFGGMFKTGEWNYEYVPHIYEFNFKKMSWSNTGRFLSEYKGFSQVVKMSDCLGILGGHSYQNNKDKPVDTVEKVCK